jgi:hypothetical protein
MKRIFASGVGTALLVLLCHCGSSSSNNNPPPPNDAGSGIVLTINDFDAWCTLTVSPAPNATATTYTEGTVVNLHAVGNTGFTFDYWLGTDGANSGNGGKDPSAGTTVTMTASKTVLACCDNATERCPTSL